MTEESKYVCRECGEPWESKYTPFYANGKCSNCGASPANKVDREQENSLMRDGEEDE